VAKKLEKYSGDIHKVYDIVALRIIVKSVSKIATKHSGSSMVHGNHFQGKLKTTLLFPRANGYQSLHTTVFTGTGG
jgi:guanosine-3',5'-bis(diphosphate) 3'-pyrophosphohydrolase